MQFHTPVCCYPRLVHRDDVSSGTGKPSGMLDGSLCLLGGGCCLHAVGCNAVSPCQHGTGAAVRYSWGLMGIPGLEVCIEGAFAGKLLPASCAVSPGATHQQLPSSSDACLHVTRAVLLCSGDLQPGGRGARGAEGRTVGVLPPACGRRLDAGRPQLHHQLQVGNLHRSQLCRHYM